MKFEDVDGLLTELAEEFEVPKPNYCIYRVETVKPLDPFRTPLGATIRFKSMTDPTPYGACFVFRGKMLCFITLLLKGTKGVSRRDLIHEFFHYLSYVRNGYKEPKDPEKEERWAERQTRRYLKKSEDSWGRDGAVRVHRV